MKSVPHHSETQKRRLSRRILGQGLVEYIALTALVAVVSLGAVKFLGTKVRTHIQGTANRFDRTLRTGLSARGHSNASDHDESTGDHETSSPLPRGRGRSSVFDILNSL